jgi:flagellar biosynthesis/type III secretory pathway protein FliH
MDAKLRERFGKLIGKLGSDQDGERANAASLCTKFLREHRLTWADVIAGKLAGSGQETGQMFSQGYARGFADGFANGVKQGREEARAESANRRARAVRRALTEKEAAMLAWLETELAQETSAFSGFEQDFIRGVSDQYQRLGGLSDKQISCLTDIYERHTDPQEPS